MVDSIDVNDNKAAHLIKHSLFYDESDFCKIFSRKKTGSIFLVYIFGVSMLNLVTFNHLLLYLMLQILHVSLLFAFKNVGSAMLTKMYQFLSYKTSKLYLSQKVVVHIVAK